MSKKQGSRTIGPSQLKHGKSDDKTNVSSKYVYTDMNVRIRNAKFRSPKLENNNFHHDFWF